MERGCAGRRKVGEDVPALLFQGGDDGEDPFYEAVAVLAVAAEAELPPDHCASHQRQAFCQCPQYTSQSPGRSDRLSKEHGP